MAVSIACPHCQALGDQDVDPGARARLSCASCGKAYDAQRIRAKGLTSRQIAVSQISGYEMAIRGTTADRDDDLIEFWGMVIPQVGEGDEMVIAYPVDRRGGVGKAGTVTNLNVARSWSMPRQTEKLGCSGKAALIALALVVGAAVVAI